MTADDEFYNEECPSGCSTDHPVPDEVGGARFACPEVEQLWYFCNECGGWAEDTGNSARSAHGDYLCEPAYHGYFTCNGCERILTDDLYDMDGYCLECYEDEPCDCSDCREDYGQGVGTGNASGIYVQMCDACGTQDLHVHGLTEAFLCDHRAMEAHLAGEPVEFASNAPVSKMLMVMGVAA